MDINNIGTKLGSIRNKYKISQTELARKAGISLSYYGQIEREEKMPSVRVLVKICEVLNISVDELLSDYNVNKDLYWQFCNMFRNKSAKFYTASIDILESLSKHVM